jgi:hypothetical protein
MDRKEMLLAMYPDAGPGWREAIEAGVDVSLLEYNLSLTVEQRLLQLDEMLRIYHESRLAEGSADATDDGAAASAH